jgi:NADPH-dependent 2,4-dienoyl-CoA reductase/sulfur reductase-like enzyme
MPEQPIKIDLLIIGGGPAGMAAAIAAWDAGCRDLIVLERDERLGGILPQCIHNGFGLHRFKEELTGPEYAARDLAAVCSRQIPWQCGTMVLEVTPDRLVTAVSPQHGLQQWAAGAVILAMGCRERPRGALGTPGTRCSGIMTTGTAQRLVNLEGLMPGRKIVILGSGDIGLIMARRLTFEGAQVLACVEIMPFSSGLGRNVVQCLQDFDIPLLLGHTVIDIEGDERLTGVTIAAVDPQTLKPLPGTENKIACDTLLLSVGLIPENELSRLAGVTMSDKTQGPLVDQHLATKVPGIFACGNVLHVHDLADEVSAEASRAGQAAVRWLAGHEAAAVEIPIVDGFGVRGVVPQFYRRPVPESPVKDQMLRLQFRPDAVYRRAVIRIEADGQPVKRFKKLVLAPGEMVAVDFDPQLLPSGPIGQITVSVSAARWAANCKSMSRTGRSARSAAMSASVAFNMPGVKSCSRAGW